MTLKTNVLVENICNLSEARYCSGMGVQLLACPVAHVNPTLFAAIKSWITGPSMILDISESEEQPDRMNEEDRSNIENLSTHSQRIQFVMTKDISVTELEQLTSFNYKVLVSFKKTQPGNLGDLLSLPIAGLVLTGQTEAMPGLKNYDHLSTVLEQLETSEG